jgi:hypothetical protein
MVDAPCDLGLEEPREDGLQTPDTNYVGLMNTGEYKRQVLRRFVFTIIAQIVGG